MTMKQNQPYMPCLVTERSPIGGKREVAVWREREGSKGRGGKRCRWVGMRAYLFLGREHKEAGPASSEYEFGKPVQPRYDMHGMISGTGVGDRDYEGVANLGGKERKKSSVGPKSQFPLVSMVPQAAKLSSMSPISLPNWFGAVGCCRKAERELPFARENPTFPNKTSSSSPHERLLLPMEKITVDFRFSHLCN